MSYPKVKAIKVYGTAGGQSRVADITAHMVIYGMTEVKQAEALLLNSTDLLHFAKFVKEATEQSLPSETLLQQLRERAVDVIGRAEGTS